MLRLAGTLAVALFGLLILSHPGTARGDDPCTTDTLRLVGFTTIDHAAFLSVPDLRFTGVIIEVDSYDWGVVGSEMDILLEIYDGNTAELVASSLETYSTSGLDVNPFLVVLVELDEEQCLTAGPYRARVHLDPDETLPDCDLSNNQDTSPNYNLDVFSGELAFGDINTTINTITSYNLATKQITGTALWNDSVTIDFTNLEIDYATDCDAMVVSGSGSFTLPQPVNLTNWPYFSTGGVADSTGARAEIRIPLPSGILYKQFATDKLYREGRVTIGTQKIEQDFSLAGSFPVLGVQAIKAENLPFSLDTFTSVRWSDADGFELESPSYEYIHAAKFAVAPFVRNSNDRLFYYNPTIDGDMAVITPDGLELDLSFGAGILAPAFPFGVTVPFDAAKVSIVGNALADGSVVPNSTTELQYNTNACFGAAAVDAELIPTEDYAVFPDGASWASLTGLSNHDFAWDAFELYDIDEGRIYLPGFVAVGKASGNALPHEYLLAGRTGTSTNPNAFAMYGENAYVNGLGEYAGLTVQRPQMDGKNFQVTIACQPLALTATSFSKVYARRGGFNGVLDGGGGLPATFMMYGEYDTTISTFNYSFLDNQQALESGIDGEIRLPFPSNIDLPFSSLELTNCGDPGGADVSNVDRTLAYWQAQFLFAGMEFRDTGNVSSCGTDEKTLWTTSSNQISRLDYAVLMETNFLGNGDIAQNELIGEAANILDDYNYTLRRVFYTRWDNTVNPNGLTVLIGDIRLPFWGLTPVKALIDSGGLSYIRQGRNFAENPPVDNDLNQDGFPDGSGISSMSAYNAASAHHPNVIGKFANIITFDYPVVYNRLLKQFSSPDTKGTDLVVITMESSVRSITREQTEVLFGLSYEGLPTLNLSQAAGQFVTPAINAFMTPIQNQLDTLANNLNGNLSDQLKPPVGNFLNPNIQTYLNGVKQAVANNPPGPALDAELDTLRTNLMNQVEGNLQNHLRSATGPVQSGAKQALNALDTLENTLSVIDINLIRNILVGLIEFTGNSAAGVDAFLSQVEQAKNAVEDLVKNQIRPPIQELQDQIDAFDRFLLLDNVLGDAGLYSSAINGMNSAVMQYTNSVKNNPGIVANLSTTPLRNAMVNSYMNSNQFIQLNAEVHTLFAPLKQQMTESTLALLDVINNTVNNYLDEIGAAFNDAFSDLNDVIGVKAAKLNGYAVFSAETLDRLHIGAEFALATPDSVNFSASLDMERIKHDGTGASCGVPDSGDTIKVTIKISGIPIKFAIADLEASIAFMVTLWDTGGSIQVRNFAGSIDTKGSIGFASVALIDPGFGIGVGLDENYFYFVGKVTVDGIAAKGGIFLGRNCDGGSILEKIDPEVADVIKVTEIFGIFTSAEAAIPILDYGCFLRAGATVGAGFWFFVNGPQYGAKLTGGLFGEAACIVSVRGRMSLIGAKDAVGYVLSGNLWVAGGIGFCSPSEWFTPQDAFDDSWCAVCVAFVKVTYRPKSDWNASYSVKCSL